MNNQLMVVPGHRDHPPQPVPVVDRRPARRVGLLDRAALHVGVALITWGRRPVRAGRRDRLTVTPEMCQARRDLERLRDQHELQGALLTRLR